MGEAVKGHRVGHLDGYGEEEHPCVERDTSPLEYLRKRSGKRTIGIAVAIIGCCRYQRFCVGIMPTRFYRTRIAIARFVLSTHVRIRLF